MVKKIVVIYDDRVEPNASVQQITGGKTFGDTIFKRKTMLLRFTEFLSRFDFVSEFFTIEKSTTTEEILEYMMHISAETAVIHLFSNFGIKKEEDFSILLKKACFINQRIGVVVEHKLAMGLFPSISDYIGFIKEKTETPSLEHMNPEDKLAVDCMIDLGKVNQFLQFITGGFDARFFNALEGDDFTVTKKSANKKKIKKEYQFYHLLPDNMKIWFVMPFDYQENEHFASYTMERLHITDVAIRWIHKAMDSEEFEELLNRLFFFLKNRNKKQVTKEEYQAVEEQLYVTKVRKRLAELQKNDYYHTFEAYLTNGTKYQSVESVFEWYERLYAQVMKRCQNPSELVIGHGDLCFSNMLYHKETKTLRLIDPKGAFTEEELWTNPFYDVAKLSHSICGKYDFFNSGLYDIKIQNDCGINLKVDFDNSMFLSVFKQKLQEEGFDYLQIRLYEASLFLSMLPLHMDNPQKVFAFLLNALTILEEVESCLKE